MTNFPIAETSTPLLFNKRITFFLFLVETAMVIRSWDSEIHISQGCKPLYFSGTRSRSTINPPDSFAISPTEEERPPAPLSVMLLYKFLSLSSFIIASENFFWVIGSPICTAVIGLRASNSSEENVAP